MKAWYFSQQNCKLRYKDNRLIKAGVTHYYDGMPILCEQGLHASKNILNALKYAPGAYIWRVEMGGTSFCDHDKMVATERTYLWGYDATNVLRHFARLCALDVIHLWDAPDVAIQYLKTGDENLRRAARNAAWGAAWSAAGSAAWSAAWSAARSAAVQKQSHRLYKMIMDGRR